MKNVLIFLLLFGVFSSCKKKTPSENCYALFAYDSVYCSNKALIQHYAQSGPIKMCGFTSEMMDVYLKQHSPTVDTVYNAGDSIYVTYQYEKVQIW